MLVKNLTKRKYVGKTHINLVLNPRQEQHYKTLPFFGFENKSQRILSDCEVGLKNKMVLSQLEEF